MKIVEQFLTLQGEGKYLGVPSYFIRSTGCNLRCEWIEENGTTTKCDTPYTSWSPEKGEELNLNELLKKDELKLVRHIVITGGEPCINKDLPDIVNELIDNGYHITVETNGTIYHPNMSKAFMSISPKLSSSYPTTDEKAGQIHSHNNNFFESVSKWIISNDYEVKFVINNREDIDKVIGLQSLLGFPDDKVYLMPQGITQQQLNERGRWLFDECIKLNYRFTPRLHIDLFGNKRGI